MGRALARPPARATKRGDVNGMRIGLVSDTHLPNEIRSLGDLGKPIEDFLSTVDLILHGGDIVTPGVLDYLEQFAPVVAAQGNHDQFADDRLSPVQFLTLEGWRIAMCHDLPEDEPVQHLRSRHFRSDEIDIMIGGHTHYERLQYREGAIIMNSGSPIFPQHKMTRLGTAGLIEIMGDDLRAEIVLLGETDGRPNPGEPSTVLVHRSQFTNGR